MFSFNNISLHKQLYLIFILIRGDSALSASQKCGVTAMTAWCWKKHVSSIIIEDGANKDLFSRFNLVVTQAIKYQGKTKKSVGLKKKDILPSYNKKTV